MEWDNNNNLLTIIESNHLTMKVTSFVHTYCIRYFYIYYSPYFLEEEYLLYVHNLLTYMIERVN